MKEEFPFPLVVVVGLLVQVAGVVGFAEWKTWPAEIGWPWWTVWAVYGGSLFVLLLVLTICISCCCCCCNGRNRRCCVACRCSACCQPMEYIANYAPPALENTTFKRGVSGRRLSGIDPDADVEAGGGGGGGATTSHINSIDSKTATASGEFAAADRVLQLIGGAAAVSPSIKPIVEDAPTFTRDNSLHGGGGGGYLGEEPAEE